MESRCQASALCSALQCLPLPSAPTKALHPRLFRHLPLQRLTAEPWPSALLAAGPSMHADFSKALPKPYLQPRPQLLLRVAFGNRGEVLRVKCEMSHAGSCAQIFTSWWGHLRRLANCNKRRSQISRGGPLGLQPCLSSCPVLYSLISQCEQVFVTRCGGLNTLGLESGAIWGA